MTTDGPAALYELADRVAFDAELKRILIGKRLHDLADQWKAERERNIRTDWRKCPDCGMDWPHPSETSSFVCPSCRSAAALAALERARALLAEIEREAREQITAPDTNAAQMVVSEAVAETCRRIAAVLEGGAR